MSMPMTPEKPAVIHPLWLRITHWLNALAMLIMVTSGWRIYNASWDPHHVAAFYATA